MIPTDAYDLIPTGERDAALENMRRHVEQQMTGLRAASLLQGLPHTVVVDHGNIWPMIQAMVEKQEIDLLVIGTHGRRGVEKLLLGSTAEEIPRCAGIPLLMVGPGNSVPPETEANPRRILYATDFSQESEAAMHYACTLAREHDATLSFLHVAEDVWKEPLSTRMKAEDFFRMRFLEKHWVLNEGITPEYHVEFGPPARRILSGIREEAANRIDCAGCARRPLSESSRSLAWAYGLRCGFSCPLSRAGRSGRTSS